jgi:hypothetical protein
MSIDRAVTLSIMFGPIFALKLRRCLCPCFEYDRIAREALTELENLPVVLYSSEPVNEEDVQRDDSIPNSVGKFAARLWKGTQNKLGGKRWKRIVGMLAVVDSPKGPAIRIRYKRGDTTLLSDIHDESSNADDGVNERWILLSKISAVKECFAYLPVRYSGIILFGKSETSGHKSSSLELLRFEVRENKDDMAAADVDRRNEILEYIRIMVNWDKRRRSEIEEEDEGETVQEDENEENDGVEKGTRNISVDKKILGPSGKDKHFEEREIELQNRRREREQRKARYLKESGGLKYTAIIMANKN